MGKEHDIDHVPNKHLRQAVRRLRKQQRKMLAAAFADRHSSKHGWSRTATRRACRVAICNIRALEVIRWSLGL